MLKRLIVMAVMLAFGLLAASAAIAENAAPAAQQKAQEMVAKAKAAVAKVNAQAVRAAIDSKEKAVILDVRDPQEYADGHLPGAVGISRGTLEFAISGKVPDPDTKIYVYCKTGGRASLATKTLNDLGYKNAVLADMAFADWVKAGNPVEK